MEFRLLGPLEVADRDHSLALGGVKQRSLLAVLLLHANQVVSADRLIDELWGDAPPPTAAKSIQVRVSRARKELGNGRLETRTPGYVLRVDPSELVRTGPRAGGLAPAETRTRFGWSLTGGSS